MNATMFAAWLDTKPPGERYDYDHGGTGALNGKGCAIHQYLTETLGVDARSVGVGISSVTVGRSVANIPREMDFVAARSRTFGEARHRLREVCNI